MRAVGVVIGVALLALLAGSSAAAQTRVKGKTTCTDVPIRISIVDGSGVLTNDGKGYYETNKDGVNFAMINICGSSPTYDATMGLVPSTRVIGFTFQPALAGSIIDRPSPVWANGTGFWAKPIIYVRNILWGRMNGVYDFTTRVIIKNIVGPKDSTPYDLRIQAGDVDALDNPPPFSDINLPSETGTVRVQDLPGTCRTTTGGSMDQWIVTVNPSHVGTDPLTDPTLYVGTLYRETVRSDRGGHSGQYTVPFKLWIEAQTCIPAALTR